MPAKIAVIYASTYGHVRTLAETIYEEVKATGAQADIYRIPEILSEEVRQKMHAAPLKSEHPEITADKLTDYDGFLFGFPTRYGRAVASVSAFFDTTGGLWGKGALIGKFAGVFTSTASQHGGQETTALTTIPFFAHHGIIWVPGSYAPPELTDLSEIIGGSAYGAAAIAAGDGSRAVTEKELSIAKQQAKSFSNVVSTFVKGKSASTVAAPSASESKAIPASAAAGAGVASTTTAADQNNAKPYQVTDNTAGQPQTKAAATPAATPAAAAQSQQPKKKGGLFASCCGGSAQKDNFES